MSNRLCLLKIKNLEKKGVTILLAGNDNSNNSLMKIIIAKKDALTRLVQNSLASSFAAASSEQSTGNRFGMMKMNFLGGSSKFFPAQN